MMIHSLAKNVKRNKGMAVATLGLGGFLLIPPFGMAAACVSATLIIVGVIISED